MILFSWNPASYYVADQFRRYLPGENPANPSSNLGNITEYRNPDVFRMFKGGPFQSFQEMRDDYTKSQWWLTVGMAQGLPPPDGVNPFDYVTHAGIYPHAFQGPSLPQMQMSYKGLGHMSGSRMMPGRPGGPSIMPMSPRQCAMMNKMQNILRPMNFDKPCTAPGPSEAGPPPSLLT